MRWKNIVKVVKYMAEETNHVENEAKQIRKGTYPTWATITFILLFVCAILVAYAAGENSFRKVKYFGRVCTSLMLGILFIFYVFISVRYKHRTLLSSEKIIDLYSGLLFISSAIMELFYWLWIILVCLMGILGLYNGISILLVI